MQIEGKRVWQQAAGDKDRNYVDVCIRWGVILNGPGNHGHFIKKTEKYESELNKWKLTGLRRFVSDMKDGDIVVLRVGTDKAYAVGEIVGDYIWSEAFGDIGDLSYERYIAGLYLNAQSLETTNAEGAIQRYTEIYNQAPNYLDVRSKIYSLRVKVGDAYYETFDFCPAVVQYEAALQLVNSPDIQRKLETAQSSCSSGSAPVNTTPQAGNTSTEAQPTTDSSGSVAPIGQRP